MIKLIKLVIRSICNKILLFMLLLIMSGFSFYMIDIVTTDYIQMKYKISQIEEMFEKDPDLISYVENRDYKDDGEGILKNHIAQLEGVDACGNFTTISTSSFISGEAVMCVVIEKEAIDIGNLMLSEEEKKSISEYEGKYNQVYVGEAYRNQCNIGDKFPLYMDESIDCIVVGFLKKDAAWPNKGNMFLGVDGDFTFKLSEKIVVITDQFQKYDNSGGMGNPIYYSVTDEKYIESVVTEIKKKSSELEQNNTVINEGALIEKAKENNQFYDNKTFFAAVLMIIIAIISISATSITLCMLRKRQYGIMMVCGINRAEIVQLIFAENAFMLILASLIVWGMRQKELFGQIIYHAAEVKVELIEYPLYYAHCQIVPVFYLIIVVVLIIISGIIPAVIVMNTRLIDFISKKE